jgi:hypothetical protein
VSINAIRGLVLFANVALLALIGVVGYRTFYYVDPDQWEVEKPHWERYEPPAVQGDERQRQQAAYKVISKVFDPPKPKEEVAPPVAPPPTADVHRMTVVAIQYNTRDPKSSSALLTGPLAKDPRFFMADQDLGQKGMGFEAYDKAKVKQISEKEVIIIDQQGKEVRLPGPAQPAGKERG